MSNQCINRLLNESNKQCINIAAHEAQALHLGNLGDLGLLS